MTERHVKPLNDFAFKKAMGEPGDEVQLLSFLNAVLEKTGKSGLRSVEIIDDKDIIPDFPKGKAGRLDVLAELSDGAKVNIEVQLKNEYNIEKRSLFYWGSKYAKGISSGEDYECLTPVIMINIVDYPLFELDNFHTSFHIREDDTRDFILSNVFEMHFLDFSRFRLLMKNGSADIHKILHCWMLYLNTNTPEELLEEVIKMDKGIEMFHGSLEGISRDPANWRLYESLEKAKYDWNSSIKGAERKGIQQGIQQGQKELLAMLKNGMSLDEASRQLGL